MPWKRVRESNPDPLPGPGHFVGPAFWASFSSCCPLKLLSISFIENRFVSGLHQTLVCSPRLTRPEGATHTQTAGSIPGTKVCYVLKHVFILRLEVCIHTWPGISNMICSLYQCLLGYSDSYQTHFYLFPQISLGGRGGRTGRGLMVQKKCKRRRQPQVFGMSLSLGTIKVVLDGYPTGFR